ncbi:hypothetical protein J6590_072166 [Homalodisca vitripennis]|nr:hypothetical protein J6590_072166 [Homalodisca vitripennis]
MDRRSGMILLDLNDTEMAGCHLSESTWTSLWYQQQPPSTVTWTTFVVTPVLAAVEALRLRLVPTTIYVHTPAVTPSPDVAVTSLSYLATVPDSPLCPPTIASAQAPAVVVVSLHFYYLQHRLQFHQRSYQLQHLPPAFAAAPKAFLAAALVVISSALFFLLYLLQRLLLSTVANMQMDQQVDVKNRCATSIWATLWMSSSGTSLTANVEILGFMGNSIGLAYCGGWLLELVGFVPLPQRLLLTSTRVCHPLPTLTGEAGSQLASFLPG